MENNLKLSIGLETSGTDAAIEKLKRQLKSIQDPQAQLSGLSQAEQQRFTQNQQIVKKTIIENEMKELDKLQNKLKEIQKLRETKEQAGLSTLSTSAKENELLEKKAKKIKEIADLTGQTTNEIKNQAEATEKTVSGFEKIVNTLGKIGSAMAVLKTMGSIAQYVVQAEGRANIAQGQTSAIASRPLQQAIQGRGAELYYYGEERQKAMDIALKQNQRQQTLDKITGYGGAAAGAVLGGSAGSALGFTAGMALAPFTAGLSVPALTYAGTAAGAALGGYAGSSIAGGLTGRGQQSMQSVFDPSNYQKAMTAEGMQNYEQQFLAEQLKDPEKKIAMDAMYKRNDQFKSLERSLGMSGREAPEYLRSMMQYGGGMYTAEEVMGNQQRLMQSGALGSDLKSGLAGRASELQQYGISNAGGLLGRISAAGGEGQTDDKMVRVLAAAVKRGVDDSVLPQDINRFAEMAVAVATQGGGFSEEAINKFSAGMEDFSQRSIQASAGAQSYLETVGKQSEGFRGALGLGFITGNMDKFFGKDVSSKMAKDPSIVEFLNNATVTELESASGKRMLEGMAEEFGVEPEAIKEFVKNINKNKETMFTGEMSAEDPLSKMTEMTRGLSGFDLEKTRQSPEFKKLRGQAIRRMGSEEGAPFKGMPLDQREAAMNIMSSEGVSMEDAIEKAKKEFSGAKQTEVEEFGRQRGKGQIVELDTLLSGGRFEQTAAAAKQFNAEFDQVKLKFQAFFELIRENKDVDLSKYSEDIIKSLKAGAAASQPAFDPFAGTFNQMGMSPVTPKK